MAENPFSARQVKLGEVVMKVMAPLNTWIYRASKGRIGAKFPGGAPICIVTTTGRRSGKARTVPLLFLQDDDDVVVVASKGGMPEHPDWYHNISANPEVQIEIGTDKASYVARTADAGERADLWPRLCEIYSSYADYQARTDREIPVVICSPA
jgi:deazaflavin-dependent oxidoreductase (nitroreductase family)